MRGGDLARNTRHVVLLTLGPTSRTNKKNRENDLQSLKFSAFTQAAAAAISSTLFAAAAHGQPASPAANRAAPAQTTRSAAPGTEPASQRLACTNVTAAAPLTLALGKSRVVQLESPAVRLIGGGRPTSWMGQAVEPGRSPAAGGAPAAAAAAPASSAGPASDGVGETEITLLSPTELLVIGRRPGSANVIIQDRQGRCMVRDIYITVDPETLQGKLRDLLPNESGVRVTGANDAVVLTGTVTDAATLDQVMTLANVYGDSKRVVNLLRVTAPQQVMLEVQIAEVSKNLLDRLGASVSARRVTDGGRNVFSMVSDFLSGGGGLVQALRSGRTAVNIDAQQNDGVVRVLAEPNIMAISGQSASFLSGGKIFIPVAQTPAVGSGFATITLEEKEFGVGLKFTPTVLDGRVNLKITSEVSELSQTGTPFTTVGNVTAVLPSLTTRRVDTTVQLGDGQSFMVAGLIRHNVTDSVNKFPGLGEAPLLGALFRSTEFQNDQTELMFVVTPRLVKPLAGTPTLPTQNHVVPSRTDVMLKGAGEGPQPLDGDPARLPPAAPIPPAPAMPAPSRPSSMAPGQPPASVQPPASEATAYAY